MSEYVERRCKCCSGLVMWPKRDKQKYAQARCDHCRRWCAGKKYDQSDDGHHGHPVTFPEAIREAEAQAFRATLRMMRERREPEPAAAPQDRR